MNWEIVGAIAEIVGTIGVIVSLLYLAQQIRQGNRDIGADALQKLGLDYSQHSAIVLSKDNVSVYMKGLESFSDLTPEERIKFDYCVAGYINLMEHSVAYAEAGRAAEVRDMYELYLSRRLFAYPGVAEWWKHNAGGGFSDPTLEWVSAQIQKYDGAQKFWHDEV